MQRDQAISYRWIVVETALFRPQADFILENATSRQLLAVRIREGKDQGLRPGELGVASSDCRKGHLRGSLR